MFCTHCGTQVDEGKNFCKNCGTRVGKANEPVPAEPPPVSEATRTAPVVESAPHVNVPRSSEAGHRSMPLPQARPRQGIGTAVIVGASVIVILAAAAGIYFGTDLLRQPATQEPPPAVAEAPALPETKAPADTLWEDAKNSSGDPDNNLASVPQSQQPEPLPPGQVESPNPPPEILPKPAPKTDASTARRQPQSNGQDAPASARATRPAESAPASRRGGVAGIYQTMRPTTVFQSPSASSQVLANIPGGTRVNVVNSTGEWLEVHSRRGNPPGFIRRDDATFVEKTE